ncbi:CoA transferase [Myxococcota bacterium]|nr:CoA transferase [Myxococcota bacterium]
MEHPLRPRTVLSLEQALSLTYATLRFVHLGWRVIRVEGVPRPGERTPGDPNRYVGGPVGGPDRSAYFVAPNVGKEAIALDLQDPRGQDALHRLVRALPVDVFCCNTLPSRYRRLGIHPEQLQAVRPELTWVGISAYGSAAPDRPGYDPVLQARLGYMDLTGERGGPPLPTGVPTIDLKAGDEVFAQTCLSLLAQAESPGSRGRVVEVSMAQAAASWLQTSLPLPDLGEDPATLSRHGADHRQFVPVNVYPAADGFVYLAVGNDTQWRRLLALPRFAPLAEPVRETNEGRKSDRDRLHRDIAAITRLAPIRVLVAELEAAQVPASPITPADAVADLPEVSRALLRTHRPDGLPVRLPPPAVEVPGLPPDRTLPFPPRHGEHTDALLTEAGLTPTERDALWQAGVAAGERTR